MSRIAVVAALLAVAGIARGANYPVNTCVATKEKAAATYCQKALAAWAKGQSKNDPAGRDAAIAAAAMKLTDKWSDAEAKSAKKDSDCADATLSSAAAIAEIDSAIGAIVGEVNDGLDLNDKDNASCGAKLLKAAGKKCKGVLNAAGGFIAGPGKDGAAATRDEETAKAESKFSDAFAKGAADCPTTATEGEIEGLVDGLRDAIVRDTTISPNVDDTQFTQITPTGPIEYLGKTLNPTCIHDTPYSFFVKRGSVNKLLVYYQGGGACWEQLTCGIPVCDADVTPGDSPNNATTGFADQSNPANPFRDWNVVFVSYCSCDIHFGDAAQDYSNTDPAHPVHIEHRGFQNARSAEKWAREHFLSPDQIFVTGSSAGAYGAWFHAPLLHETWPASHFQVLADAGNGVVTQQFIDDFFPNWNFIGNIPPDFPEIKDIIETGGGIPEYTEFIAARFPDTRWAHYATAYDGGFGGQTGFYNIMLHNNNPTAALSWWNGSCQFNAVMEQQAMDTYDVISPLTNNYRYYVGTGSRHTMWGSDKVYTDTTGGVPLLVDWVNAMLGGTPDWTNVQCTDCGLLLPGDPRPPMIPTPPFVNRGSDVVVDCTSSPSGAFLDPTS